MPVRTRAGLRGPASADTPGDANITSAVPPPTPSRTCFASLSEDILHLISKNECLDPDDLAALRLTGKTFNSVATPLLFHRIIISQLHHDRHTFLQICNTPHLSQHVREIEWQELSWCPRYFGHAYESVTTGPGLQYIPTDDSAEISENLDAWAAELFWLPQLSYETRTEPLSDGENDAEDPRQEIIEHFRHDFHSALENLSHLHTVVSRPMSPNRVLNQDVYPISVKLFQTQYPVYPAKDTTKPPRSNDGHFLFILPAMECSALPATRLLWQDEGFLGPSYCRTVPLAALKNLTALSLTLVDVGREEYPELVTALNTATNIRDLSLEIDSGWSVDLPAGKKYSSLYLTMMRFHLAENRTSWSQLRSLSLISVPGARRILFQVVENNADTLRHLYFSSCFLRLSDIQKLTTTQNLKLKSIRIDEGIESRDKVVIEDDLLCFMNKESTGIQSESVLFDTERYLKRHISTVPMTLVRDCDSDVDKNDLLAVLKNQNHGSDSRDDDKQSICSNNSSEDSFDCRHRTAPLWVWGRYFHEYHPEIFCYQVPEPEPDDDPQSRPESQSGPGVRTKFWKFTSRDNRVAYGDDPYHWFDEWDPEAGDVEEPTPYCEELYEFAESTRNAEDDLGGLKSYIGPGSKGWELLSSLQPPQGAFRYDETVAALINKLDLSGLG